MTSKLVVLAATAVATCALISPTFAGGGGVRMNFGGPLGTFVATPAHGGGATAHAPAKRKPPAVQAERKREKPQRVVKAQPPKKAEPAKGQAAIAPSVPAESTPTGSSALIQGDIPAETAADPAPASTATVAEAKPRENVASATEPPTEEAGCKKFIPAAGMTVSVGCEP